MGLFCRRADFLPTGLQMVYRHQDAPAALAQPQQGAHTYLPTLRLKACVQGSKYEVWPEDVEKIKGKAKMDALTPGGSRLEDNACRESIARFMDRAYPFTLASASP